MQPLLKEFQIVSNPIVYDAGGVANFQIPQRLNGNARCAVIGLSATDNALGAQFFNDVETFQIAGRQYHQGAGCPLALLTPGRAPSQYAAAPSVVENANRPNYFPGEFFSLSDGSRCGGLMLIGQEVINVILRRNVAGQTIGRLVLHCVEFGYDNRDPKAQAVIEAAWSKFKVGIGQAHWQVFGDDIVAATPYAAPGSVQIFQPHQSPVRRRVLRGAQVNVVVPQVAEVDFVTATAQVQTNNDTPHSAQGVPARQLIGHGSLDFPGQVEVDLEKNDYSICLFNEPAPTLASRLRIVHMFEGISRNAPELCGPGVF